MENNKKVASDLSQSDLVIATGNKGKAREFIRLLNEAGLRAVPQSQFGVFTPEEVHPTFLENALLKARHACQATGLPGLGDDSGLVVPSLGGKPGIYSSRFAKMENDGKSLEGDADPDKQNNTLLLEKMSKFTSTSDRKAFFFCVLVYCRYPNDPCPVVSTGVWHGSIADTPGHENNGFGYDPIFVCDETKVRASSLTPSEKNQLSHRGKAFHDFMIWLNENSR